MTKRAMIRSNYTDKNISSREDNDNDAINNGSDNDNGDIVIILTEKKR